ncbi:hypothetical protein [Sphingobacterium bovisgrunnientis]|uniref:hypothetical protein n=1 Tax=Sphingobacterium bovisgrunnientis TaxID=1874697 RepID=UPI001F038B88
MEELNKAKTESPEQLLDILLVLDKEKMKIQAVKSMDQKGSMKIVDPTKKNQNQFLRVDRHGDFFFQFFLQFLQPIEEPNEFFLFQSS